MTSPMRSFVIVGGIAFVIAAAISFWLTMERNRMDGPGWPPAERAAFLRSCVEKCRAAPGMTADKYPLCDSACGCAADEGEKTMTLRDMSQAAEAISSGNASPEQTAKMERLKAAGARCAATIPQDKK